MREVVLKFTRRQRPEEPYVPLRVRQAYLVQVDGSNGESVVYEPDADVLEALAQDNRVRLSTERGFGDDLARYMKTRERRA